MHLEMSDQHFVKDVVLERTRKRGISSLCVPSGLSIPHYSTRSRIESRWMLQLLGSKGMEEEVKAAGEVAEAAGEVAEVEAAGEMVVVSVTKPRWLHQNKQ